MVDQPAAPGPHQRPAVVIARIILLVSLVWGFVTALGLLITHVWQHAYPFDAEDGVDRTLASHRNAAGKAVTGFFSLVGSTGVIIGVLVVVAVLFRVAFHRWRESA